VALRPAIHKPDGQADQQRKYQY
ncbi:uncharacterized protein METZ01_LOCUS397852, partial [marine metagenome]